MMGGFIAPSWGQPQRSWIADPTARSFTFSLVNAHSRPVKLKLTSPGRKHAAYQNTTGFVQLCHESIVLMQRKWLNEANANSDNGLVPPYTALDDEYERKRGLVKPTFDLGAGFISGMPGGKFACAEIEVFAMKPQQQQA